MAQAVIDANTTSGLNSTAALLYTATSLRTNPGTPTGLTADVRYLRRQPAHQHISRLIPMLSAWTNGFGGYTTAAASEVDHHLRRHTQRIVTNLGAAGCIEYLRRSQHGTLLRPRHDLDPGDERRDLRYADADPRQPVQRQRRFAPLGLQLEHQQPLLRQLQLSPQDRQVWSLPNFACTRGFAQPAREICSRSGSLSFVHTFSPTILNEFRAGYTAEQHAITTVKHARCAADRLLGRHGRLRFLQRLSTVRSKRTSTPTPTWFRSATETTT